ncbi:MAG: aminotransferase class V-fold PLP-dependent enzyme, partial [Pseudomonadales bacterium]|nr:aminotransferase class V-fold PLP-dependent enzyme [Pseudomonadales bacterium]
MATEKDDAVRPLPEGLSAKTLAVRAGQQRSEAGEHAEALLLSSSYVFANCEEAAARFCGDRSGNVYSRYTNPTVRNFELRLAALEEAEDCVATASGMAAIMSLCMAQLSAGDHIICSRDVFGSTVMLLDNFFVKFGVEVSYVPVNQPDAWRAAIRTNTKLLFLETPSNPLNEVADIEALAAIARNSDCLLAVDNCFCSPALQQPLKLGADLVVHSATKYLDGQGRCLGGAVLGSVALIDSIRGLLRSGGPSMSPFNAWVFLKGLETLDLRMQAHSASAMSIAVWLAQQTWVERVFYAGLADHPG